MYAAAVTPYRAAAEPDERTEGGDAALATLDVSGRRGADAFPGARGDDGGYHGGSGGRGGDAGQAGAGQAGGSITIELRGDGEERVRYAARVAVGKGTERTVEDRVAIGDDGDIVLVARGGAGGRGGDGGDGGTGGRGSDGSDATRYSSGSSGSAGGSGGDGGLGSDGGRGGRGGRIKVVIGADETHWLMLLRCHLDGGPGGPPGRNGAGGAGGPGGRGGSSYSWTDTETYTDSNGQSQTRSTSHTNWGGSDGPAGPSGRDGNAHLSYGADARDGTLEIEVVSPDGRKAVYASRFDLKLLSFAHRNDNDDGIYEPEERVTVSRIVVKNVGGMPTPPNHAIVLSLRRGDWIAPEPATVTIPRSLAAGESMLLPGELAFRIGQFIPSGPSNPLASDAAIHLDAALPDARRGFPELESECPDSVGSFRVSFPLEASPISCLPSLAPGEGTRLAFGIENVSTKPFGAKSDIGRHIAYSLALFASEVGADRVGYATTSGAKVPLDVGLSGAIDRLDPGKVATIDGVLSVAREAIPYQAIRLRLVLSLGRLDAPDVMRVAQMREMVIRVAQRYRANPAAGALLVVHNRTTLAEVEAWKEVGAKLGIELALWDVSLEGHIDLDREIPGGPLRAQMSRKPIVALDGTFDTPLGDQRVGRILDPGEVLAHGSEGGHVVLVGAPRQLDGALVPACAEHAEPIRGVTGSDDLRALAAGLAVGASAPPMAFRRTYWLGHPTERELARLAAGIAATLDETLPDRRHVVVFSFDGAKEHDGFLLDRHLLGTVTVTRTIDLGRRSLSGVSATEDALHDPGDVALRTAPLALAWGLPFEERARRLRETTSPSASARLTSGAEGSTSVGVEPAEGGGDGADDAIATLGSDIADVLGRALDAEIAVEVGEAMDRRRFVKRDGDEPDRTLSRLDALSRAELGELPIDPSSSWGRALISAMATARAVAWGHVSFWELVPPFLFTRRAPRLFFRVRGLVNHLFDRAFPPQGDADAKRRRAEARLLLERCETRLLRRALREGRAKPGRSDEGRAVVEGIADDLARLGLRFPRMAASSAITRDDYDAIATTRRKAASRGTKLARAMQKERADKLA